MFRWCNMKEFFESYIEEGETQKERLEAMRKYQAANNARIAEITSTID